MNTSANKESRASASGHADLRQWIGKTERLSDIITATPCAALAATLDRPAARPAAGTPLPPLWNWLYFLPVYRQSDIGPDGHAERESERCASCVRRPAVPTTRLSFRRTDARLRNGGSG